MMTLACSPLTFTIPPRASPGFQVLKNNGSFSRPKKQVSEMSAKCVFGLRRRGRITYAPVPRRVPKRSKKKWFFGFVRELVPDRGQGVTNGMPKGCPGVPKGCPGVAKACPRSAHGHPMQCNGCRKVGYTMLKPDFFMPKECPWALNVAQRVSKSRPPQC